MSTLDYQSSAPPSRLPFILGIVTCLVGLLGNAAGVFFVVEGLWSIPSGTPIRLMGLTFLMFLIAFATAVVGVPLGAIGIAFGRKRRKFWIIAALGMVLSLTPIFTSEFVFHSIVRWHGLILKD